jgi:hypothetical protein
MNEMSGPDFEALAPGVCWYYNWHYRPRCRGASAGIQFIPMVWGGYLAQVPQFEKTKQVLERVLAF